MKALITATVLCLSGQMAFAGLTEKPIQDAQVVVFDAICTPKSATEGVLKVDLQMNAAGLFVRGSFYSYSETSSGLIDLENCQNAEASLLQQAGRNISFDGWYSESTYDAYEEVWGSCRNHARAGGGTYRCKKGTRRVSKLRRETFLDIDGIHVFNENN